MNFIISITHKNMKEVKIDGQEAVCYHTGYILSQL